MNGENRNADMMSSSILVEFNGTVCFFQVDGDLTYSRYIFIFIDDGESKQNSPVPSMLHLCY